MKEHTRNLHISFAIIAVILMIFSAVFVAVTPAPARATELNTFSNDEEEKDVYAQKTGRNKEAANITLPYDATIESATMTVSTLYDDGSYPEEPSLRIRPESTDRTLWEFVGDGYGEFGRQNVFLNNERAVSFDFPDGGGEQQTQLRLPKNATISKATVNVTGQSIGYGDVSEPVNVTGDSRYEFSNVATVDIISEGGYLYATWTDSGDLDYSGTDTDVFFKYSDDEGQTWSETRVLSTDSTLSCYHPELAASGENVYAIWQSYDGVNYYVCIRVSHDHGKTWGGPLYMNDVLSSYSTEASTIVASGDWVYMAWKDMSSDIQLITSSNNGDDWGTSQRISEIDSGTNYAEPTLAAVNDDVYVGYIGTFRGSTGNDGTYYSLVCNASSNNGVDWTGNNATTTVNVTLAQPQADAKDDYVYFVYVTDYASGYRGNISFVRSDNNGGTWRTPYAITSSLNRADLYPDISVFKGFGSDELYACWEEEMQGGSFWGNISFSKSDTNGNGWQAEKLVAFTNDNRIPAITSDPLRRVYLGWELRVNDQMYFYEDMYLMTSEQDGGSTWNTPEILSSETFDGDSTNPAYHSFDKNHYFAWMERGNFSGNGNDPDVFFRYWDEDKNTWYDQIVVSDDEMDSTYSAIPDIASDGDGTVYVVWLDNGNYDGDGISETDVLFRKSGSYGQDAWSDEFLVSRQGSDTNYTYDPQVTAFNKGPGENYVGVCWRGTSNFTGNGDDGDVFFRLSDDGGETWGAIEVVSRGSTNNSLFPQMIMDGSYVYITWEEYEMDVGDHAFLAKRALSGGSWEIQQMKSGSEEANYPQVSLSGDGYLYVSWIAISSYDIMVTRSDDNGDTWSDPVAVGEASTNAAQTYWLSAYEEMVSVIYKGPLSTQIQANVSVNYGEDWSGNAQINVDGNSSAVYYPLAHPAMDKDGVYCLWRDNGNVSGTSRDNDHMLVYLTLSDHFPKNPTLDIGDDGDNQWSHAGDYEDTEVVDIKSELSSLLASEDITGVDEYNNAYVDIPIVTTSDAKGRLSLSKLTIEYTLDVDIPEFDSYIRRYLDKNQDQKDDEDNIRVPIDFYTHTLGALTLSELEVVYSFEATLVLDGLLNEVTGELEITWEATHFEGDDLVLKYRNSTGDDVWVELASVDPDDGSYLWDVSDENGEFKIRVEREGSGDPWQQSASFIIDNLPPKTTATVSPDPEIDGWWLNADVYLSASDGSAGSRVDQTYYTLNGTDPDDSSTIYDGDGIELDDSGNYTVKYRSVDRAGLWEDVKSVLIRIDNDKPEVEEVEKEFSIALKGAVPIPFKLQDLQSGFDFTEPESAPWLEYLIGDEARSGVWKTLTDLEYSKTTGHTILVSGYTGEEDWRNLPGEKIRFRATVNDSLGNQEEEKEFPVHMIRDDTTVPEIRDRFINWSSAIHSPGSEVTFVVVSGEDGLFGEVFVNTTGGYAAILKLQPSGEPGVYQAGWDTTGLELGSYEVLFRLWDAVNNTSTRPDELYLLKEPGPDVQVSSIFISDSTEVDTLGIGSQVYVTATIYNYGNLPGTDIVLIFKAGGVEFHRETVASLNDSRAHTVSYLWTITGSDGEKKAITVQVGEDGTPEPYAQEIEFKYFSDLTVTSVEVIDSKGDVVTTLTKNEKYSVKAVVENLGDVAESNAVFKFHYRGSDGLVGSISDYETVDLPAGGSETITVAWTPSLQGTVDVLVTADPGESLDEISESNNEVGTPVEITSKNTGPADVEDEDSPSILIPLIGIVVLVAAMALVFLFVVKPKMDEQKEEKAGEELSYEEQEASASAAAPASRARPSPTPPALGPEEAAPQKEPKATKVRCPGKNCSKVLAVKSEARPQKITCPSCSTTFVLKDEGAAKSKSSEGDGEVKKVKLSCSGCGATMLIKDQKRPFVVKCPKCQVKTTFQ